MLPLLASVAAQMAAAQDAQVDITPPGAAPAGSTVSVKWSGPNGPGDYITVVRRGAGPSEYLDYRPTSDGKMPVNPVSIVMPAEPGAYEIRYLSGNPRKVLAAVPYEVKAVVASIEGPASVVPGSRFEVAWSGPNNGGDWVTIVAAGAAPRAYGSYVDVRSGLADEKTGRRTATLQAPGEPGRYELRYVQRGARVIGTSAIEVTAALPPSSNPQQGAAASGSAAAGGVTGGGAQGAAAGGAPASGTARGGAAGASTAAGAAGGSSSGGAAAGAGPTGAGTAGSGGSAGGAAGGAASGGAPGATTPAGGAAAGSASRGAASGGGLTGTASGRSGVPSGSARLGGAPAGGVGLAGGTTPGAVQLAGATADLALTVAASDPTTASVVSWPAGGTARYVVSVTNNGPAASDGAQLVVPADPLMTKTLVNCTAASGAQCPATVTGAELEGGVAIPKLPSRGTVTMEFVAGVWASAGTVRATATVSAPAGVPDPNPGNNTATQTHSIAARSTAGGSSTATPGSRATATDLGLYIQTDPSSVTMWAPNSTAKYILFVANWGPIDASGAILNVPPTPGLVKTMVACSTSIPFQNSPSLTPGQCPANTSVSQMESGIVIPGLRVGERVAFTLEARVTAALGASVTVSGAIVPPAGVIELVYDASNNSSNLTIPVVVPSMDAGIAGRVATGGTQIAAPPTTGSMMTDCRLPGPSVSASGVSLTGLSLTWPHINGATYVVSRGDMGVLTPTPLTSAVYPATIGFSQPGPLYRHITYQYTVVATYGGGCGRTTLPVTPPRPFVPILTAALDIPIPATGEHFVRLKWKVPQEVQPRNGDNHGFLLFGPGLPAEGKTFSACGAVDCSLAGPDGLPWWVEVVPAPPGNQTWLIAPFWDTNQGRLLDLSAAGRVTLTVPPVK